MNFLSAGCAIVMWFSALQEVHSKNIVSFPPFLLGGDFFPKNFPKGGAKFFAKNTKGPIIFSGGESLRFLGGELTQEETMQFKQPVSSSKEKGLNFLYIQIMC